MRMVKKTESLLFKFGIIFSIFTFVMLVLSGNTMYSSQTKSYMKECEKTIQSVASYLEDSIKIDGTDFLIYKNFMVENFQKVKVPADFTEADVPKAANAFYSAFAKEYPGKALGVDITLDELSQDVQELYAIYNYEYYTILFEKAREAFGVLYTYLCVPTEEPMHMYYLIDIERIKRESDGFLNTCNDVFKPLDKHRRMWEAWETGRKPSGYDHYDNEYGRTYAYYTPLIISGEKIGVIGVEVEVEKIIKTILHNVHVETGKIALLLVLCVAAMLFFIYKCYISKLERLQKKVRDYAQNKDAAVAMEIEHEAKGNDEISKLAEQVASMIMEIENYLKNLVNTTKALQTSKAQATMISELATKDALTGIRNKTAYDKEISRLEWNLADDDTEFGIAVIDLNDLKHINDTFGYEQGNIAIKKLCYIVCHIFQHSPVFRIGSDEFAVILEGSDYNNIGMLTTEFRRQLDELATKGDLPEWECISAAIGIAFYDTTTDSSVANVFRRADKARKDNKKEMKGGN